MSEHFTPIGGFLTCLAVGLASAALGCGSTTEVVSQESGRKVTDAVQQIQTLADNGCKVDGGDAGTVVHDATQTLVQAAVRHPGTLVNGVPMAKVIQQASAPARKCGYTTEARQLSLAVLMASDSAN